MHQIKLIKNSATGDLNLLCALKAKKGDEDPQWVIDLMNNLARYVFQRGICLKIIITFLQTVQLN